MRFVIYSASVLVGCSIRKYWKLTIVLSFSCGTRNIPRKHKTGIYCSLEINLPLYLCDKRCSNSLHLLLICLFLYIETKDRKLHPDNYCYNATVIIYLCLMQDATNSKTSIQNWTGLFISKWKKKQECYLQYCSVPITVNEGQMFTADASTSVSIVRCYF